MEDLFSYNDVEINPKDKQLKLKRLDKYLANMLDKYKGDNQMEVCYLSEKYLNANFEIKDKETIKTTKYVITPFVNNRLGKNYYNSKWDNLFLYPEINLFALLKSEFDKSKERLRELFNKGRAGLIIRNLKAETIKIKTNFQELPEKHNKYKFDKEIFSELD